MLHYIRQLLIFVFFVSFVSSNETKYGQQDADNTPVVGGESVVDSNSPIYREMATEALNKYLQQIDSNRHHAIQVLKVTTQVVAGIMTRINFNALPTTCQLDQDMKPANPPCNLTYPSKIIACYSEIWEQPWINEKNVKVQCDPKA